MIITNMLVVRKLTIFGEKLLFFYQKTLDNKKKFYYYILNRLSKIAAPEREWV